MFATEERADIFWHRSPWVVPMMQLGLRCIGAMVFFVEQTVSRINPAFVEPSNFVIISPSILRASLNLITCFIPFRPEVPSRTNKMTGGLLSESFWIVFLIFTSSAIRSFCVCSLPAVSTIIKSVSSSFASCKASYTMAEGSLCLKDVETLIPRGLSKRISCSLAAALKESAPTIVMRLSFFNNAANLGHEKSKKLLKEILQKD